MSDAIGSATGYSTVATGVSDATATGGKRAVKVQAGSSIDKLADRLLDQYDGNDDGAIEVDDGMWGAVSKARSQVRDLAALADHTGNNDGKADRAELIAVMNLYDNGANSEVAQANDGRLDGAEYSNFMRDFEIKLGARKIGHAAPSTPQNEN